MGVNMIHQQVIDNFHKLVGLADEDCNCTDGTCMACRAQQELETIAYQIDQALEQIYEDE